MKVFLAPQLAVRIDATNAVSIEDVERYGSLEVADDSTETVATVAARLIREHDDVIGAEPDVDAPPFSEDVWWLATVRSGGGDETERRQAVAFAPGRAYGVQADGLVRFDYPKDLVIADLVRAIEDGHYGTADKTLAVTRAGEFGGNGHQIASLVFWLVQEFPTILLGVGVDRLVLRNDNKKKEDLQKLAASWSGRHIDYPYELRRFVETRPSWYPERLGDRLDISQAAAGRLLEALGYKPSPHDPDLMEKSDDEGAEAAWIEAEWARTFTSLDELLEADGDRSEQPTFEENSGGSEYEEDYDHVVTVDERAQAVENRHPWRSWLRRRFCR